MSKIKFRKVIPRIALAGFAISIISSTLYIGYSQNTDPLSKFKARYNQLNSPVADYVVIKSDGISNEDKLLFKKEDNSNNKLIKIKSNEIDIQKFPYLSNATQKDYYLSTESMPNDPEYTKQWAIPYMGFDKYHGDVNEKSQKEDLIVALIDSGVCIDHPELSGKLLEGWDFIESDNIPQDENGHGCRIAGLIAAKINNNYQIAGAVGNTKILPLRIVGADGFGTYSDLANAIYYAVDNNAQIINLSLGGIKDAQFLRDAINYAVGKGVVVVAAAGNTGDSQILFPAKYENVISVGSIGSTDNVSVFSSNSSLIRTWAPGESILSITKDGEVNYNYGTSFSTALVSAGLAASKNPRLESNLTNGNIFDLHPEVKFRKPIFKDSSMVNYKDLENNWSTIYPDNWSVTKTVYDVETDPARPKRLDVVTFKSTSREYIAIERIDSRGRTPQEYADIFYGYDGRAKYNFVEIEIDNMKGISVYDYEYRSNGTSSWYIGTIVKSGDLLYHINYQIINGIEFDIYLQMLGNLSINESSGIDNLHTIPDPRPFISDNIELMGENTCGGYTFIGSIFECCLNGSNCTWWAGYSRPESIQTEMQIRKWSGGIWTEADGIYPRGYMPKVGALVIWVANWEKFSGHVAYVTEVNSNGTFNITEMNCGAYPSGSAYEYNLSTNSYRGGNFVGFVYPKTTLSLNALRIWQNQTSDLEYKASNEIVITDTVVEPAATIKFYTLNN